MKLVEGGARKVAPLAEIEMEGDAMSDSHLTGARAGLTRRSFLKGTAAGAMAAGSLSALAACAPQTQSDDLAATGEKAPVDEGTWIAAACWSNCGGRCVNRVLVREGEIVRMGSDTSHEDSFDWRQQRGCPRGRARAQMVFGEERVKYPMKRKSWQPGGGANAHGELRGKDEWEQISWDEAIGYIAQEAKRIYDAYGPTAVIGTGNVAIGKIMRQLGGHVTLADTASLGTYKLNVAALGLSNSDLGKLNDRYDNKNADTIVIMGGNSVWSSGGSTMNNFNEAKDAGVQFVYVGPSYSATAAYFEARWVPVYPGTDTAFMLGVCYEMIQQDVVDYDFLDKYCVGFDGDHMPSDATTSEHFRGYLEGEWDATPKTAEWASAICGTPADDIRWFAETVGKDHAVMLLHNYALARCLGAENVPQLFMTMGAMGGHFGKSGHACGGAYKTYAGEGGPTLVKPGQTGWLEPENPIDNTLLKPLMWKSIMEGSYNSTGTLGKDLRPETICEANFKWLHIEASNLLQTGIGTADALEGVQKLDLVSTLSYSFDNSARYADIVLPCATEWERVGGFPGHQRSRETLIVYTQVTEPLCEAKTEYEIGRMMAEAVGVNPDELWPCDEKQAFFNQIAGSTLLDVDGEEKPLVTITSDDIQEWGVTGEAQEGFIALADFLSAGCYTVKRSEGDAYFFIGYKDFIEDPEGCPLESASGKFEIYNQPKADSLDAMGYSPAGTYKPYPNYVGAPTGREGTFVDGKIGGEPSEYPFIMYNPHYLRRSHSVFDGSPWLREAWPNPVFVNASDAAAKGVADGDTVKVSTPTGSTLRTASVTEIIMPGCVALPHGAWMNLDETEGVDRGGMDNYLCGSVTSGMGTSGYNNYNCNFEKYAGEALQPDCELPARVVELA